FNVIGACTSPWSSGKPRKKGAALCLQTRPRFSWSKKLVISLSLARTNQSVSNSSIQSLQRCPKQAPAVPIGQLPSISSLHEAAGPSWDFSKTPNQQRSSAPLRLPPKLAFGAANDPLEHEADRVADQLMRMPNADLSVAAAPAQLSGNGAHGMAK